MQVTQDRLEKQNSFAGIAVAINKSVFSMGGYDKIHEQNLPYLEFFSFSDKNKKKSLLPNESLLTITKAKDVHDIMEKVCSHYKIAVGVSYGAAAVLAVMSANHRAKLTEYGIDLANDPDFNAIKTALVYCYRPLYEDLGLSGYTPKAAHFFQGVAFGKSGEMGMQYPTGLDQYGQPVRLSEKLEPCLLDYDRESNSYDDYHIISTIDFFKVELKLNDTLAAEWLLRAFQIASTYAWIEKGGLTQLEENAESIPKWRAKYLHFSIICGCVRRLGQGVDASAEEIENETKYSLWDYLESFDLLDDNKNVVFDAVVHEALTSGLRAWKCVRKIRADKLNRD